MDTYGLETLAYRYNYAYTKQLKIIKVDELGLSIIWVNVNAFWYFK